MAQINIESAMLRIHKIVPNYVWKRGKEEGWKAML